MYQYTNKLIRVSNWTQWRSSWHAPEHERAHQAHVECTSLSHSSPIKMSYYYCPKLHFLINSLFFMSLFSVNLSVLWWWSIERTFRNKKLYNHGVIAFYQWCYSGLVRNKYHTAPYSYYSAPWLQEMNVLCRVPVHVLVHLYILS